MQGYHEPVLLREVVEALDVKRGNWYLDCTLGDGGHSLEILKLGGNVLGIDVDPEVLERVKRRLGELGKSGRVGELRVIQGNFRNLNEILNQAGLKDQRFKGIVFDLGVSSLQLERGERGFSFQKMGPLDMRMDPTLGIQALDLVNNLSGKELYELFKNLGEEKYSRGLADSLVSARALKPFRTTLELADVIERTLGSRRERIHPATKVFQALRIAVNDELNALQSGLEQALDLIEKNGHILVVSFHSLEDRIVKNTYREWAGLTLGEIITKKPITPSDEEEKRNPRSRSAKLRIFEKI